MPDVDLEDAVVAATHDRLVQCIPANRRALERRVVHGRCKVQLLLIESVKAILEDAAPHLQCSHLSILLDALQCALAFAADANGTKEMWTRATTETRLMQLLVDQERNSTEFSLRILDALYSGSDESRVALAEARLVQRCYDILNQFLHLSRELPVPYKKAKVSMTLSALRSITEYSDAQFCKHLPSYYDVLCELMLVPETEVRARLCAIMQRVGRVYVRTHTDAHTDTDPAHH
eukprot:TRINITY_DN1215_c0_g1_i1.p1 TRINITY_DN1215_c0_g1~~TRINITY_DN1215_c0_g1_i1.p1  ORF type:complete len:273 (-),score=99.02 TRINITY_DN1215_c0_g1_i1:427-1128(-)